MTFKVRRIRQKKSKWESFKGLFFKKKEPKKKFLNTPIILLVVFILCSVFILKAAFTSPKDSNQKSTSFFKKFSILDYDEFGHTNILLLGIAGKNQQGGHLSDSIMIMSIDSEKNTVSLLSLPRDLFVKSSVGNRKINEVYASAQYKKGEKEGLQITKKAISDFTNIEIHYGAVINFKIFQELVDELGGVKIFVPQDIVDPFYPAPNFKYQTFTIRKGIQILDGETALKYARSRKTSSDYSRAQRQQDLLLAIKETATSSDLLLSPSRLKNLYTTYSKNINTDLGIKEMLALAKVVYKINYKSLVTSVLNDDPTQKGGFLYAPAREFYGGQFVLLPSDLKAMQKFIQLDLIYPQVFLEGSQISIKNGSKVTGLAGKLRDKLKQFGLHVIEVGNYKTDTPVLTSFYKKTSERKIPLTIKFLEEFLNIKEKPPTQSLQAKPENNSENIQPEAPKKDEFEALVDVEIVLGLD